MTGRISEEKIQEIRERTDIVEVVSSYLPLKRSGANHLGLCPFHQEKTPSFNVNATRQIYHCFGCGVGGDVFSFLMRMEGLSFPEALRRLGERAGIEVEEQALSPAEEERRREIDRLCRLSEVACDFYHRLLMDAPEGAPARRYLKERGFGREAAQQFQLGYAPERWEALAGHLAAKGLDLKGARERLGLLRPGKEGRGDYDLFRRRLLFPILDLRGRVVAFGGRVLDDALPKYINSPESPIYHKGRILFGLYQAREGMRQSGEGIVVEGYFDQMALYRAGFPQAVATCGTALTAEHARLLKRYAKRLLLLFDQDSAGRKATFRAMDVLLPEEIPAAVVELDPGEDPDSFLRRRGSAAFRERLAAARPVLEVYIEASLAAHGESVEGRARAVEEILAKLRLLPGRIERSLYCQLLARRTGLDEGLLQAQLGSSPRASQAPPAKAKAEAVSSGGGPEKGRRREPKKDLKSQGWLLHLMLIDTEVRRRVVEEGVSDLFFDEDHRVIAELALSFLAQGREIAEMLSAESLNGEQKALLSGILLRDEKAFSEETEAVFEGCRQAAAKERLKIRYRELLSLIRRSEQAGQWEEHAGYLRELLEIKKQL